MMLVQTQSNPQDPPQPALLVPTQVPFKDTFWGQVMVGTMTAVITAYLTAALLRRRGEG